MNSQTELKLPQLLDTIRHHFDFLFERGFRIISVMCVDARRETLQVVLASHECVIGIECNDSQIKLALNIPELFEAFGFLDFHQMLALTDMQPDTHLPTHPQDIKNIAWLLMDHLDEIVMLLRSLFHQAEANKNGQLPWSNCPFLLSESLHKRPISSHELF